MTARMELGKRGENAVCDYLTGLGHIIVARNWRNGHLEVDVISLAPDGLHFVEVKSRVAPYAAEPELSVNATKQRRIISAARAWLLRDGRRLGFADCELFFDVASVVFEGAETEIRYYPGAYIPLYT